MPRWGEFKERFLSLIKKTQDCWEWIGDIDGKGYGRTHYKGRRQGAHRVSYQVFVGEIPIGLFVCHHCDNKLCVNPNHLFIGTQKDNMQDWTKKGKNRLANDRALWANGKHWKTNATEKEKMSKRMSEEFNSGRRVIMRGDKGRIIGTRMGK